MRSYLENQLAAGTAVDDYDTTQKLYTRFAKDIVQIDALQNEINEVETNSRVIRAHEPWCKFDVDRTLENRPTRRPHLYATHYTNGNIPTVEKQCLFSSIPFQ